MSLAGTRAASVGDFHLCLACPLCVGPWPAVCFMLVRPTEPSRPSGSGEGQAASRQNGFRSPGPKDASLHSLRIELDSSMSEIGDLTPAID
jgi:hypothetical protein